MIGWKRLVLPDLGNESAFLVALITELKNLNESERFSYAEKQYKVWLQKGFAPALFPAVPERNDWWYICQILPFGKHIFDSGESYAFTYTTKEVLVPAFLDSKSDASFQLMDQMHLSVKCEQPFTLEHFTEWIIANEQEVLTTLHIDQSKRQLRTMVPDELLRLAFFYPELGLSTKDGWMLLYGMRTISTNTTHFIAGHSAFGGVRYFDTLWSDMAVKNIMPFLIIGPRL